MKDWSELAVPHSVLGTYNVWLQVDDEYGVLKGRICSNPFPRFQSDPPSQDCIQPAFTGLTDEGVSAQISDSFIPFTSQRCSAA